MLSHHLARLEVRRERYSSLLFDFSEMSSDEIFPDKEVLVGKFVLNRRTGNLELEDSTGSIPICPMENRDRFEA